MTHGVQPGRQNAIGWSDSVDTPHGRLAIPFAAEAPDLPDTLFFLQDDKVSGSLPLKGFNPDAGDFTGSMSIDSIARNSVMVSTPPLGYESPNWSAARYDLTTKKFVYVAGHHSQFGGQMVSYATIDRRH